MKKYLSFVRSGWMDVLAWACFAFLVAIWLIQTSRDVLTTTDTGHAAYIGLREDTR